MIPTMRRYDAGTPCETRKIGSPILAEPDRRRGRRATTSESRAAGGTSTTKLNWSGSTEENRLTALTVADAIGLTERMKGLVETCLAEYDISGWTVPDLINLHEVS